MGDAEQMWITAVPALEDGEADEAELVLIGIDPTSDDPGQRVVDMLLDRGHEGEEGVFYLLPFDLGVRCERVADRLAVLLLTSPEVYDRMVREHRDDLAVHLRDAPLVDGGVLLLRREITTDFDPATDDGDRPVVLLLREGRAAEPDLFSAFDEGEAALAVLGTWGGDE
ncbi:hypothetical protein ACQPYE_21915 [Actinosynnema sp. CA-299493]